MTLRGDKPWDKKEVRQAILDKVSKTGGHFSSNLGTVELTVAMYAAWLIVPAVWKEILPWIHEHKELRRQEATRRIHLLNQQITASEMQAENVNKAMDLLEKIDNAIEGMVGRFEILLGLYQRQQHTLQVTLESLESVISTMAEGAVEHAKRTVRHDHPPSVAE